MTKNAFINLITEYNNVIGNATSLQQVGVNIFESKFKIIPSVHEMLHIVLEDNYNEDGREWIYWFIYDNKLGRRGLEAKLDDGTSIFQTIEELYNYIEDNHKHTNNSYGNKCIRQISS